MKGLRDRATYANVMSTIAVLLALGGGAYAAGLGRNTVGSKQLRQRGQAQGHGHRVAAQVPRRHPLPRGRRHRNGSRGAGTVVNAIDACNAAERRLPGPAELMGFAREPGITIGPVPTAEWAAGLDSAPGGLQSAVVAEQGSQVFLATDPFDDVHGYRCAANARGRFPQTPRCSRTSALSSSRSCTRRTSCGPALRCGRRTRSPETPSGGRPAARRCRGSGRGRTGRAEVAGPGSPRHPIRSRCRRSRGRRSRPPARWRASENGGTRRDRESTTTPIC